MDSQKSEPQKPSSCRRKKNEEATFIEDLKDHIDEFIHASMDEHKTCFQKTINKVSVLFIYWCLVFLMIITLLPSNYFCCCQFQMFGLSKAVAEKNANAANGVESSLPLQTTLQD